MGFQRNHIDEITRVEIGLGVYLHKGIYGYVSKKAREYLVSRWFIYYCYFQLILLLDLWEEEKYLQRRCYCKELSIEERVVSLYLDCESSVSGVQRAIKSLFGEALSAGRISEILNEYGSKLPFSESGLEMSLKFVSDEIFSNGKPILVTVEPLSGYILQIKEVENRDKESWGICWLEIVGENRDKVEKVISDHGRGLYEGIKLVFSEEIYQEDLFHVIIRLAYLQCVFEKKAYSAINNEYQMQERLKKARNTRVFPKVLKEYEESKLLALNSVLLYDNFVYLFKELQKVLEMVDEKTGFLKNKKEVIEQVEAILNLMEEIGNEEITKGVNYFRKHQENLLKYFDEVEIADKFLEEKIPDEFTRSILILIYHYNSKLYSGYGKVKGKMKQEIDFWQNAILEIITPEEFMKLYEIIEAKLSKILRSSSIVENTNSRLRRFSDSSRGQINQNRLNLIRFYLNHKTFERGRRKGKSPSELFHNEDGQQKHWLEILRASKLQSA